SRKGMHLYLTKHQYKNTFTEDLWEALEEASKKPVAEVMSTWTKQKGFPAVTVDSRPSPGGVTLTLSQSKFTSDGLPPSENYIWMAPVSISTSKNPGKEVASIVLKEPKTELFVPDVSESDWIKVNPGTIGFYRTRYPPEMLERLLPAIRDQTLPPLDRLGLINDLFAMVKAGHTGTVEALKLLKAFEGETNYNVWSSINGILARLSQLLGGTEYRQSYEKYQKELLSNVYNRLGWKSKSGETHLDTLLRSLILCRMALLNDPKTIEEARTRLDKHAEGKEVLPADLRTACYKAVLHAGGQQEFDTLLKLYRATDLHEEKDRISRSLGSVNDVELLKKVLEFAMSDEVRTQDKVFVIIAVSLNAKGRDLAWEFFKTNWTKIKELISGSLLTSFVKYLTENFSTEEKLRDVERFFQEHSTPGTERTVQQSVETIQLNIKWLERDGESIRKYLS
ncbi:puromycin-sensitive aminopeptidase-like, partial [Sitophilus oryzae]|uniref:Puromycin-sensitive aminopeptidase n=1 Tax=Sitophilus oryzae TaxID=7048 RepID=A0A6J2X809_SITOR